VGDCPIRQLVLCEKDLDGSLGVEPRSVGIAEVAMLGSEFVDWIHLTLDSFCGHVNEPSCSIKGGITLMNLLVP
jgi:hypothetical protein